MRAINIGQLILFCFLFVFSNVSHAESAEEKGLRIARELEKANSGFVGEESSMEMVLIDAHGTKTTREMQGLVKEVDGDGDKSISIFLNPRDVKGTKMLTWSHKDKDDDQWLYLPSFRRVKRINSRNKSASFMGSEFSYEDLGSQEIEKYNYKWLKDQKTEGEDTWVLERVPKSESGYSKQVLYVSKKYKNPVKVEYYDRKGELLKVATFKDFQKHKVGGKELWRAHNIHMNNVQTKKQSTFVWKERRLGVKHRDDLFSKKRLR